MISLKNRPTYISASTKCKLEIELNCWKLNYVMQHIERGFCSCGLSVKIRILEINMNALINFDKQCHFKAAKYKKHQIHEIKKNNIDFTYRVLDFDVLHHIHGIKWA